MAGQHLKDLLRAYRDGDDLAFRRAGQRLVEAEEARRHPRLAGELRELLAGGARTASRPGVEFRRLPEPPRDRDSDLPLADLTSPSRHLRDLVLEPRLQARLAALAAEVDQWQRLDAAGVPRRRRVLLHGPPGCGKTSIAAALAGDLGRPLMTIRAEAVLSSFLGETASNLRHLFDFAAETPLVVLFDEFDSLGKARDDPSDHGELRRVVNAVLQLIDAYDGPSLLVAATNHEEVLDGALWRRFDEVLEVGLPDEQQIGTIISRKLIGRLGANVDVPTVARALVGQPQAAAERLAQEALRRVVLAGSSAVGQADLVHARDEVLDRRWM